MKKIEANPEEPRIPIVPMDVLENAAYKLFKSHDLDPSRSRSLVSDILHHHGAEAPYIIHRLSPEKQREEFLGILEDPSDIDEIEALLDLDKIPESIKKHYGLSS